VTSNPWRGFTRVALPVVIGLAPNPYDHVTFSLHWPLAQTTPDFRIIPGPRSVIDNEIGRMYTESRR